MILGFPGGSVVKNLPANVGDMGLILRLEIFPGEGNSNPHHYCCWGNLINREAWWLQFIGAAKQSGTTE